MTPPRTFSSPRVMSRLSMVYLQMLVDDVGDVTVTNDGATILKLLEVEHPAAKVRLECMDMISVPGSLDRQFQLIASFMLVDLASCFFATRAHFKQAGINAAFSLYQILVELAELQDAEVGDGTTSVVILAAELLKRANELVKNKIHPTNIISGYRLAMREVREMRSQSMQQVNHAAAFSS